MIFHGFWLVSMVFQGSFMVFMVFGWFPWFFMVPGWFFMDPGWFFMVFLQNIPAQTVSWPDLPVWVRRPEGGIGPSDKKKGFWGRNEFSALKYGK